MKIDLVLALALAYTVVSAVAWHWSGHPSRLRRWESDRMAYVACVLACFTAALILLFGAANALTENETP